MNIGVPHGNFLGEVVESSGSWQSPETEVLGVPRDKYCDGEYGLVSHAFHCKPVGNEETYDGDWCATW